VYEAGTPKSFPGLGPTLFSREYFSDRKSKNIVMLSAFQLGGLQWVHFFGSLVFDIFGTFRVRDVIVTFRFLFIFSGCEKCTLCSPPNRKALNITTVTCMFLDFRKDNNSRENKVPDFALILAESSVLRLKSAVSQSEIHEIPQKSHDLG